MGQYDNIDAATHIRPFIELKELSNKIKLAVKALKRFEYDALAFRGMSGALIAAAVALRVKKPLIMVRKPNDTSHSSKRVEGYTGAKTYIIIDDFVCTGKTANAIMRDIKKFSPKAKCLGVLELQRFDDPNTVELRTEESDQKQYGKSYKWSKEAE